MAHGSNVQYGIATVEHGCSAFRITTAEAHGFEYETVAPISASCHEFEEDQKAYGEVRIEMSYT